MRYIPYRWGIHWVGRSLWSLWKVPRRSFSEWRLLCLTLYSIRACDRERTSASLSPLPSRFSETLWLYDRVRRRSHGARTRYGDQSCSHKRHSPLRYQLLWEKNMSPPLAREETWNLLKKTSKNGSTKVSYRCLPRTGVSLDRRRESIWRRKMDYIALLSCHVSLYLKIESISIWSDFTLYTTLYL